MHIINFTHLPSHHKLLMICTVQEGYSHDVSFSKSKVSFREKVMSANSACKFG